MRNYLLAGSAVLLLAGCTTAQQSSPGAPYASYYPPPYPNYVPQRSRPSVPDYAELEPVPRPNPVPPVRSERPPSVGSQPSPARVDPPPSRVAEAPRRAPSPPQMIQEPETCGWWRLCHFWR
jgi:hypothetical protein